MIILYAIWGLPFFILFIQNNVIAASDCHDEPIGLAREDVVADDWFSSTSASVYAAKEARMNRRGWTTTDLTSSLKIKLYKAYFICAIGTRGGRDHADNWVKSYKADLYSDSECTKKVKSFSLDGNSNNNQIVVRALDTHPLAKCVKITPTSVNVRTAMRVELYGHLKDENADCKIKGRSYKCTCKPGTFIQPDRTSCMTKKNLDTSFWVKVAANAYEKKKLVSYGSEQYEFERIGSNETSWMYNSEGSIIADGIPLKKERLTANTAVAYKDSSKGDDLLLFGKLKGQKKDSRQLVLPVATIYKGKRQQLTKRMDNYQELEDFVYGKERQVTEDNLKIAGNEDHCSEGTHDCQKIAGTVCVTGDYPGTYSCLCHGGIAPVEGKCNIGTSRKHQVLVKGSGDSYSLGTILFVGRRSVTIQSGGKTFTSFNDEFKDYQPIDVLRDPSDEAIQKVKSVILIAGHRYVPGRVTSSKVKERKYTVKTSSGKTYSNRDAANIILDGSNHTLLDYVASCPENSVRVSGRYPGTYWCYCKGKIENDRCSAILYGYIMYPKYDIYKHFKSIVRYADYTLGLKELRFKETTVFVSGKNHLLFGNDDINYRGKVGEVVLGYFEPGWKNLTYQLQGKVEGHTKSNDLYVHWKAKEFAPSLEQQKIVDINGCKSFGHVCGKNAGICITSKVPTAHTCQCYPGFQNVKGAMGEHCVDVNECHTKDACGKHTTCKNTAGSYSCPCHIGFAQAKGATLSDDCQDVNECDLKLCSPNAMCENSMGSYKCACKPGFRGDGKTCTGNNNNTYHTSDINECKEDPKLCSTVQGAVCANKLGSYECKCTQSGFRVNDKKTKCIDIEECEKPGVCSDPNAKCVEVTGGGHTCPCKDGYRTVKGLCTDYDQCKTHKGLCGDDADCEEKVGGYQCHCHIGAGYEVDPVSKKCVDIDECVVEPDRCLFLEGGKCQNSVGGASCECNTGYHSQPNPEYRVNSSIPREKCVEEDECKRAEPVCTEPGKTVCEDLAAELGGFKCHCADGYKANSDGMCDDVDECIKDSHNCDLDTTNCLNEPGGYKCNCKPGFGPATRYILQDDVNKTSCFNPSAFRAGTTTVRSSTGYYLLTAVLVFVHGFLVVMAPRY